MFAGARGLAALSALAFTSLSQATIIKFDVSNVGDSQWRYDYSVTNDTLADPLEEFAIFFDYELYADLSLAANAPGWDSLIIQPDLNLPDDGFLDSLALAGGIGVGGSLGGFSVLFTWLGVSAPGDQAYTVIDPSTFGIIESGRTAVPTVSVPEPGSIFLVGIGLLALFALRIARKGIESVKS